MQCSIRPPLMLCIDTGNAPPSVTNRGGGGGRKYLLVVRRAPIGPGLGRSLARRAAAGPCTFHVISLARSTSMVMLLASAGDPGSGYVSCPDLTELKHEEVRRAEAVLNGWLQLFHRLGCAADGEVSEEGPVQSIAQAAIRTGDCAEVLLMERASVITAVASALGIDAAQRVRRRVDVAVSCIVA